MNFIPILILLVTIEKCLCQDFKQVFEEINKKTEKFNAIASEIAWESAVDPGNQKTVFKTAKFQKERLDWQQGICNELSRQERIIVFNNTQLRQKYLLCRGPKYTYNEARLISQLYEKLQTIYTEAEVCILTDEKISSKNLTETESAILNYLTTASYYLRKKYHFELSTMFAVKKAVNNYDREGNNLCLRGEDDFQRLMAFSKNEKVLLWLWLVWRERVGPSMKAPYIKLVELENAAARRNGYTDIGESWREEQEIPNISLLCRRLYEGVKPLYSLLHGVVRFFLRREYGEIVPEKGLIPAHLLGNLWSQNWEPLANLIIPKSIDLNESIKKLNWTVEHMVKRAEDFYQSLGLPPMTNTFWKKSIFVRDNQETRCHGAAADMFRSGDFRLLYCSGTTIEDFYVLHHEIGHIQYYMAYENQPSLFRQANTAFHEAIGDTIMFGVMTPQHLHRLGLINDSLLYSTNVIQNEDTEKWKTVLRNIEDSNTKESKTSGDEMIMMYDKINIRDEMGLKNDNFLEHFDKDGFHNFDESNNKESNKNDDIMMITNDKMLHDKMGLKNKKNVGNFDKDEFHNFDDSNSKESYKNDDKMMITNDKINLRDKIGIKDDNFLDHFNKDKEELVITTDEILLLKQALNQIPQIPFSLLIDEYRWKYFGGDFPESDMNKMFWQLSSQLQGITPPFKRGENYFDVGAKFHVPDNTPYIRYFLSSFLKHQLFESLCKASVFGRRGVKDPLPRTIAMNRCDIYGSKTVGKLLKDLMSRGHSQHWKQILQETTGYDHISSLPLKRYYRPLYKLLEKLVKLHQIPIGW